MKQTISALTAAAIAVTVVSIPNHAQAENGRITAGVLGGLLGGAIIGSALAPRPYYGPPAAVYVAPEPVYDEPICVGRRQVYDGYYRAYRWQRVEVPCY